MSDFFELTRTKPDGYPFFREAAEAFDAGEQEFVKRTELVVDGRRIIQEWSLTPRPGHDPPRALNQVVYEKLQEFRREIGAAHERSVSFPIEDFSHFLFGAAGPETHETILESVARIFLCHMALVVFEDGRKISRGGGNAVSGYGTVSQTSYETGEKTTELEVSFWDAAP